LCGLELDQQAIVNMMIGGEFLTSWASTSLSRTTLFHGVTHSV